MKWITDHNHKGIIDDCDQRLYCIKFSFNHARFLVNVLECEKENEMWSVYSTCVEKYCANITSPVEMSADCDHEGCICGEGFFRNELHECVTFEECAKCRYNDVDYMVCLVYCVGFMYH